MSVNFYGLFSVDIVYVLTALTGVTLLSIVIAVVAVAKSSSMKKKYESFMCGEDGKSIEKLVKEYLDDVRNLKIVADDNTKNIEDIYDKMQYTFQKIGLVKYDAFHEMGGKLSFALCMLDKKDCGYIINVMHSNNGCFAYAKEIVGGESYIELGDEEQKALNQARAGRYGDEQLGERVNRILEQQQ